MVTFHQLKKIFQPIAFLNAFRRRIPTIPFRFGSISYPGTFLSYIPDRYSKLIPFNFQKDFKINDRLLKKYIYRNRVNNKGDLSRFYFLLLCIEQLKKENINGNVLELGVYKGNTAVILFEAAKQMNTTLFLLDTFSGFSTNDLKGLDADKRLEFKDTSLDEVKLLLGPGNIRYIKGYFPETICLLDDADRYALIHIDCDLHAPFLSALNYFYPRLISGGFLIMHDYSSLHWKGVEAAIDTFFKDKPEKIIPIPDKSGTAVIRKI